MIEYGEVTKTDGDMATVSFIRRGECDRCQICSVSKTDCKRVELSLKNILNVNAGDYVKVQVFKKSAMISSLLIYILPLALVALGAGLGSLANAAVAAIVAVLGLVVGLAFAVPIDVFVLRRKSGFRPVLLEVCSESEYIKYHDASQ